MIFYLTELCGTCVLCFLICFHYSIMSLIHTIFRRLYIVLPRQLGSHCMTIKLEVTNCIYLITYLFSLEYSSISYHLWTKANFEIFLYTYCAAIVISYDSLTVSHTDALPRNSNIMAYIKSEVYCWLQLQSLREWTGTMMVIENHLYMPVLLY